LGTRTKGVDSGERDSHGDDSIGWGDDERMKGNDRWMRVGFEVPDNLHFVPSARDKVNGGIDNIKKDVHSDLTRAAVVEVLFL
jgi:hypothetical protein